ncbi:transcriptional regulator FtrA [Rhizobium sp. CFBP 8762]|nr:transcriptional regulator FtrA [Rhizobium sp. CFBP 8762]
MPCIIKIMTKPADKRALQNANVVALAYDGLCTFEFGVAVEVFGLARPEMGDSWYRFAVASADDGPLRAAGGVRLMVDGGLELLDTAGTIIIPGWRDPQAPVPPALVTHLQKAHQNGARLLSICSGVFVLAATGLLNGQRATTHWRYVDVLARLYPKIQLEPDVLYIDNGALLTSAGSAAGIDLCLHLVRRDFGTVAANSVARRLVVPPHRDGGQAQFVPRAMPVDHESGRLGPLLDTLRQNLTEPHTVASMARRSGMGERTFLRRFQDATGTTPSRWILTERLNQACRLLEETALTLDQIAQQSGFGAAATLRHHFQHRFLTTPSAYRKKFS